MTTHTYADVCQMLDQAREHAELYRIAADAMAALLNDHSAALAKIDKLQQQVDDFHHLQRFNREAAEAKVRKAWEGAEEAIAYERARIDRYTRIGNRVAVLASQGRKSIRVADVMDES